MMKSEVLHLVDESEFENELRYQAPALVELGGLGELVNGSTGSAFDLADSCAPDDGTDPFNEAVC